MGRRPVSPESSITNMEGMRREGMLTDRSIDFYGEQAKIILKDLRSLHMETEPWRLTIEDAQRLLNLWEVKGLAVSTRRGYFAALRTFGRLMWLAGVRIETITKMLGHTSSTTTLRYIGVDMDDMSAAMREFLL